ncbi:hypothetical protein [Deinococcus yunweiensis]|uniref:hypothetical protein n=1 Tax=Deinococcus yunweiensis TaxID=367282 RepID=UPI00398EB8CD
MTPILTDVVGVPATITKRDQLTGVAVYDPPYLGGDAVGAGVGAIPFKWVEARGRYEPVTGDPAQFRLPVARADVEGVPAYDGRLLVELTWVDEQGVRQTTELELLAEANAQGVLNLTETQRPIKFTAATDLLAAMQEVKGGREVLDNADAARLVLLDAAQGFDALAAQVQPALDEMAQATDTVLDQAAQVTADALGVAGINPAYVSETTADPPAAPDGTKGAKRLEDGSFQRLVRMAGVWVTAGAALLTLAGLHFVDARRHGVSPLATAVGNATGLQAAVDAAPYKGTVVTPPGTYTAADTVWINKSVMVEMTGVNWRTPGTLKYAFIVHGGVIDRTVTGNAWIAALLEMTFEDTVPVRDVTIRGVTTSSSTGGRSSTNILFYFADNSGVENVIITQSQGNGVEYRQCDRPFAFNLVVEDWAGYGLFIYQCHAFVAHKLTFKGGGRMWEMKQRHKNYWLLEHTIDDIQVSDCIGFPAPGASGANPAWATAGVSYNDIPNISGATPAAIAARNFPGHHISVGVTITNLNMFVSPTAGANVSGPTFHLGPFARGFNVTLAQDGGGRAALSAPLVVGPTGTNGATDGFGGGHIIRSRMTNYANDGASLVEYTVGLSLVGWYVRNCTTRKVLNQGSSSAATMPGGQVDKLELIDADVEANVILSAIGEQAVRVRAETQLFVGRRNRFKLTPVNDPANPAYATFSPFYISAQVVDIDDDQYTAPLNPAATNHTTTYGYLTAPAGTVKNLRTQFSAPTNVRCLVVANGSTNALVLDGGSHALGNTPTGEKIGLRLDNEVQIRKSPDLLNGALLVDNTARNAVVSPNRVTFGTAAPTTGTWAVGDRRRNIAPALGGVSEWVCITAGTPGVWVDSSKLTGASDPPRTYGTAAPTTGAHVVGETVWRDGNYSLGSNLGWVCYVAGTPGTWAAFGQAGVRVISAAPTFNALFIGEELLDSSAGKWYKAISVGNGAADWKPISYALPVSFTLTPPSIANGAMWESGNLALAGAVLNDEVRVAPPSGMTGLMATAYVTSSGLARVQIFNGSGGVLTPASATYKLTLSRN